MATERNKPVQKPKLPKRALRLVGQLHAHDVGAGFPSVDSTILCGPALPEYPLRPEELEGPWERYDASTGQMIPMRNPFTGA